MFSEIYRKNAAAQIEPQNADTYFARACAVETHVNISQETLEDPP